MAGTLSSDADADVMGESLFCASWSAREELVLLEAVEEFGYGNWSSVAEKLGRSVGVCKTHYDQFYLHYTNPLQPVLQPKLVPELTPPTLINGGNERGSPVTPYYSGEEIGCYMPHRGDFAVEPHNNAEHIIADVELEPEEMEDDLFIALKLAAVNIYSQKLKQRMYRKLMIREYGLLDIRKEAATDKIKLNMHQLATKQKLRPFMRFINPEASLKLLQSLFLADELKRDIQCLQEYRVKGITTREGAILCERLLKRRKLQKLEQAEALRNACTPEESIFAQLVVKPEDKKTARAKDSKQTAFNISHLSGVERLRADEKELCQQCRLHPEALLQYLHQLETEWGRTGRLRLVDARKLLKIDVNKTRRIFNFLVRKGRIG